MVIDPPMTGAVSPATRDAPHSISRAASRKPAAPRRGEDPFLDAGWASGAVRRQRQARLGDVLIAISGGEGVEHLAELYVQAGKPIIPLDLNLGCSVDDGVGGGAMLYRRALAAPREFMRLVDPPRAPLLLSETRTDAGQRPTTDLIPAILGLIEVLAPPTVFCVRLLNPKIDGYGVVERYFRQVVEPVVHDLGYDTFEPGRGQSEYAWMNEEVFDRLHYSSAVVVDVTGLRNNCFMELGYALGHSLPVIVTALDGTQVPFDSQMLPHHFWSDTADDLNRQQGFREFWLTHINRPSIVRSRSVV